jgi:hypothetical protein
MARLKKQSAMVSLASDCHYSGFVCTIMHLRYAETDKKTRWRAVEESLVEPTDGTEFKRMIGGRQSLQRE